MATAGPLCTGSRGCRFGLAIHVGLVDVRLAQIEIAVFEWVSVVRHGPDRRLGMPRFTPRWHWNVGVMRSGRTR